MIIASDKSLPSLKRRRQRSKSGCGFAFAVFAPSLSALLWCGGMTEGSPDDSGMSSCTYFFSDPETICEESDSMQTLGRCHHVLDDLIDGGLDVEILPHRCRPTVGGCCTYNDNSGTWNVCYYGDAFTPAVVQGVCVETDGQYVTAP
jgi:hypothetical protein